MFDNMQDIVDKKICSIDEEIAALQDKKDELYMLSDKIDGALDNAACEIEEHRRERISDAEYEIRDMLEEAGLDEDDIEEMTDEFAIANEVDERRWNF